jgi:hypothetical protein
VGVVLEGLEHSVKSASSTEAKLVKELPVALAALRAVGLAAADVDPAALVRGMVRDLSDPLRFTLLLPDDESYAARSGAAVAQLEAQAGLVAVNIKNYCGTQIYQVTL